MSDWIQRHKEYLNDLEQEDFPLMALRHLAEQVLFRLTTMGTPGALSEVRRITDMALKLERDPERIRVMIKPMGVGDEG